MLNHKTILIIGSSGYLGSEITRLAQANNHVIPTHFQKPIFPNSIPYNFFSDQIESLVDLQTIDLVIFAGMIEFESEEKVKSTIKSFAQVCKNNQLVYLSSDGIFGGEHGNYLESDVPRPRTRYGRNLVTCEQTLLEYCPDLCIVRPSYIYGFSGKRLDNRLKQTADLLQKGQTVSLFDDMYKSPLGVSQVAKGVLDLAELKHKGIVHVAGARLSVYDFQHQAMQALGISTAKLERSSMPTNKEGFLRDTSLDNTLWQRLTGSPPLTIAATL